MSIKPKLVGRVVLLAWLVVVPACSPGPTDAGNLPEDILDPDAMESQAGALAAYNGALVAFSVAFGRGEFVGTSTDGSFIATAGLLADELQHDDIGAPVGTTSNDGAGAVDARALPEYSDPSLEPKGPHRITYSGLQRVRGQAREALGLLATHAPDSSALAGHLYAVIGYAEMLLAELYCSGIPLSTVDYEGTYTLRPGAATDDVYRHAIAMFDSSLVLAGGWERVAALARVGKGRSLLGLGQFADAAQAVAGVPDGFRYLLTYSTSTTAATGLNLGYIFAAQGWFATVADREGGNGLDYVGSGDPRTAITPTGGANRYGVTRLVPTKYSQAGDTPIVLADGVEARLIEAEAALQGGDVGGWLGKLNDLRQRAPQVNSAWPVLPDTTDPGDTDARVNLHFRERAFWLFLTGHRLGDMRRLVRHYGRDPEAIFPTGSYPGESGVYGTDVTAPIPASERAYNPHFTGCLNRGA